MRFVNCEAVGMQGRKVLTEHHRITGIRRHRDTWDTLVRRLSQPWPAGHRERSRHAFANLLVGSEPPQDVGGELRAVSPWDETVA